MLVHNAKSPHSRSRAKKLDDNWQGPYRVREIPEDSTYYMLEELDGTPLATTIAGNRVKKFYSRALLEEARQGIRELDQNAEEVDRNMEEQDTQDGDEFGEEDDEEAEQ